MMRQATPLSMKGFPVTFTLTTPDYRQVSVQDPSLTERAYVAQAAGSLTPSPLVGEGWGEGVLNGYTVRTRRP